MVSSWALSGNQVSSWALRAPSDANQPQSAAISRNHLAHLLEEDERLVPPLAHAATAALKLIAFGLTP